MRNGRLQSVPQGSADPGSDERAATLVAGVRSLARTQRRFRTATAVAFAARDRAAMLQLDRERLQEMPRSRAAQDLINNLLRQRDGDWSDANLLALVRALDSFPVWHFSSYEQIPLTALTKLITRSLEARPPSPELAAAITALAQKRFDEGCRAEARRAAKSLADTVSRWTEPVSGPGDLIDSDDDWGAAVHAAIPPDPGWIPFLEHARTATASKPAKRWLATARERRDELKTSEFAALSKTLIDALDAPPSGEMRVGSGIGSFVGLDHVPRAVPTEDNANLLRGLIWTCSLQGDQRTADRVAQAARACSKKLPDIGARCPKVFNACLWTLSEMGEIGAPHLVALSQAARKPSARKRAEAAIDRAAETAGTPRAVLEDMAIPTYGLDAGPLRAEGCEATVEPPGHVNLTWLDDRGRPRPKKPAKAKIPKEIKELRATLTTQRRRYERLMATGSTWPWSRFRTGVLGHPVVCAIAANLIVETEDGAKSFLPATDKPKLKQDERVRLWHPSGKTAEEILGWRERIEREQLTQPFKQAHREVYLLTPAEQESGSTTNRFGGHILRQHALNALCEARGWRYRLQGPFDPGPDSLPTIELPGPRLRAQLSVETLEDDDLQSAHAIFLYVRTEGLRFTRADTRASVQLADIPPRVLSEVLRDVDLFISVAGVAADPTWPLNVPESWAQAWSESAFGELTPLGQRRREVLQPLLAAFPAADRLSLEDRFLHVRGQRHEYRIHLGSGNVLREPGSRHVCIVAAGGGRLPGEPGHLWLPFEGDEMLALIVSKALMLARDDEIADPSIRAQLDAP